MVAIQSIGAWLSHISRVRATREMFCTPFHTSVTRPAKHLRLTQLSNAGLPVVLLMLLGLVCESMTQPLVVAQLHLEGHVHTISCLQQSLKNSNPFTYLPSVYLVFIVSHYHNTSYQISNHKNLYYSISNHFYHSHIIIKSKHIKSYPIISESELYHIKP